MLKFCIGREDLLVPLERISGSSGSSSTGEAITNNVLIDVFQVTPELKEHFHDAPYALRLKCFDTEIEMSAEIAIVSDAVSEGVTTVNTAKFITILKTFPEATLMTIALDGNNLLIASDNAHFSVPTLPADSFPQIDRKEKVFSFVMKRKALLLAMKSIAFAIGIDGYRYFLRGMRFSFEGTTVRLYAADGHRLSMQESKTEAPVVIPESFDDDGILVPRKSVNELIKLLELDKKSDENITINVSAKSIRVSCSGISLSSTLLESKYPTVEQIIPLNCTRFITVKKDEFQAAVYRASLMCNVKNHGVELIVKNGLLVIRGRFASAHHSVENKVAMDYEGDDFELAFNANYLLDICKAMTTSKLKISMSETSNNALIEPVPVDNEEPNLARYIVSRVIL